MSVRSSGKFWAVVFNMLIGTVCSAQAMTTLDHASVIVERQGDNAPQALVDTTLPYRWDAAHGGIEGKAYFQLPFSSSDAAEPQALFIARVGNTYEVVLNGVVLGTKGRPGDPYADNKKPVFFNIPAGLLREKNMLDIAITAQSGRHAGLTPVVLGPVNEVRDIYLASWHERQTGYFVIGIISSVLGALALLLWLRQHESMYVFYGLAELLFAFRISDGQFDVSPLPWPWWGIFGFSAQAIGTALILKFSLSVMDRHHGALKHICNGFMLLTLPVMALSLFGGWPPLVSAWKGVSALISIVVAVVIVPQGLRSGVSEQRIVAGAYMLVIVALIRDTFIFKNLPGYYGVVWTVYAWVLFSISMAWIIAERMRKSTQEIAIMNQTLSRRLAEREAELNAVFAQQTQSERQQAMQEERQRLTRDMHDGLGSQLLGALHLAQNPAVARDTVAHQLRETLDHLKLTVDAMQDTEGDIASLLGALRYRLGPRLEAAGVQLAWSVEALPAVAGWTLQQSRDLQMILFEAFSNLITHAGASHATLRAVQDANQRQLLITLEDNGRGFNVDAAIKEGGHGIANMHLRAARINAQLHIERTSNGTKTTLTLPLGVK
jgi:signal transduction histidine kinase